MYTVFTILTLIVFAWFIFSMIKPAKAAPFLKKPTRLKTFGIFFLAVILCGTGLQAFEPAEVTVERAQQQQAIQEQQKVQQEKDKQEKAKKDAASAAKKAEADKPKLELIEQGTESGSLGGYVTGTVKNNTDKKYGYAQVEINLYDSAGAQIGSTLANTNNLEAKGTWKFKAPVLHEGVATYKIMGITGY